MGTKFLFTVKGIVIGICFAELDSTYYICPLTIMCLTAFGVFIEIKTNK